MNTSVAWKSRTTRPAVCVLISFSLLAAGVVTFAEAAPGSAPTGKSTTPVSSSDSTVPSLDDLGLPPVPSETQADSAQQKPQNQKTPPANNAPSLSDLGFSQSQTQGGAQEQALLNKRTHMLKVHQTLVLDHRDSDGGDANHGAAGQVQGKKWADYYGAD
ncbi:MAG: hypothetical protein WA708_17240 [Acidobacteriaceae bacterium]